MVTVTFEVRDKVLDQATLEADVLTDTGLTVTCKIINKDEGVQVITDEGLTDQQKTDVETAIDNSINQ